MNDLEKATQDNGRQQVSNTQTEAMQVTIVDVTTPERPMPIHQKNSQAGSARITYVVVTAALAALIVLTVLVAIVLASKADSAFCYKQTIFGELCVYTSPVPQNSIPKK